MNKELKRDERTSQNFVMFQILWQSFAVLDQNTSTNRSTIFSTSTTLEFQTSDVSGAIPPSCCLPDEKKAPGMRLVNYVT